VDPRTSAIPLDDPNLVVDVYMRLLDHLGSGGENEDELLVSATPGQRAVYTLMVADGEVNNGGFAQFLTNSSGRLIKPAIGGAQLVGAERHATLLREAAYLFPGAEVPMDDDERNELWNSLPEDALEAKLETLDPAWYELADELDDRLRTYITNHPGEFFRNAD
jgi:Domain of unknown function (DUF4375)